VSAIAVAYIAAVVIGILVGAIELASRYRDRPQALAGMAAAWVYVAVNAAAAGLALMAARTFGWTFGISENGHRIVVVQVLICGFGAMAIFRSAFAQIRVGDQDTVIGPNAVLASLLAIVDREVDRKRGNSRSVDVSRIMRNVSFEKAKVALPAYCLALLQNFPPDEQVKLNTAITSLAGSPMSDALKSLNLGLLLMNIVGPELLDSAVQALRQEIAVPKPDGTAVQS
jgi:hypothetical protein